MGVNVNSQASKDLARANGESALHDLFVLTDEQILDHVPRIAATAAAVEADLGQWVGELRRRGVTWARIGASLGMTRQSAWERFSGEE